jgi:hypothetical protein
LFESAVLGAIDRTRSRAANQRSPVSWLPERAIFTIVVVLDAELHDLYDAGGWKIARAGG